MRWVVLLLLLPGCMGIQECNEAWAMTLDQDLYDELVALGARVERPQHTLGGAGFPGHQPEGALVEVIFKPVHEKVGGNAGPHVALYAGSPPEVGLKEGDTISKDFLHDVAGVFMPTDAAARELVQRLLASPVAGHMDYRTQAPGAELQPADVDGAKLGGSSGTGFWTEDRRGEHRYELSWEGPTATLDAEELRVKADNRGKALVISWPDRPGPEHHAEVRQAFAAAGLPAPDFTGAGAVPTLDCTVQRPW